MHSALDDWKNGWFGISLGFSSTDVDQLIAKLLALKNQPDQHFHISNDYVGTGGLGDIEIYLAEPSMLSNMRIGEMAMAPGDALELSGD